MNAELTLRASKLAANWRAISRVAFRDARCEELEGQLFAARAIRLKALCYRDCASELEALFNLDSKPEPPSPGGQSETTTTHPPS